MISNKEKRLSQAYDVYSNQIEGPSLAPMANHVATNHVSSYGMINNHLPPPSINTSNGSNGSSNKDHLLNKKHLNERNSHSLNHDFSQLYITNLKSNMIVNNNHSLTQAKKHERYEGPVLPTLEEINSYKKDANEAKKQMMQMEKSITYWSDCTDYWRTKWRKSRDEKSQNRNEIKQLKSKLGRLEHQLQISEDKRSRLSEEVNVLHSELSKYIHKFDTEGDGRHRAKQPHSAVHYNSDRRVDYRKQRRKKELSTNKRNDLSSTEEEEFQRFDHLRSSEMPLSKAPLQRPKDPLNSLPSTSNANPKVVLRNHERLFDKKIVNRKRFSQVVMCDEDEIFQFNQEIPSNSLSKNSDNNTLKYSENNGGSNNDSSNNDNNSYQQRFMEHVSEEEEEECFPEEEEEDSSDQFRRHRKQLLLVDDSTNGFCSNKALMNHSNLSTMATNSECANAGSIRTDDVDEDSLRSDQQLQNHQKVLNLEVEALEADREGIGVDDDEDDEDDEV